MNGFIDNNLDELIVILDEIIKFVTSKDLINDDNKEIFSYINDFYNQINSKEVDVVKCDFKLLRRRVNKLIHPDLNPEFKAEANKIVTRINANIDNILEFQKSMNQKGIENYNWKRQNTEKKYEYKSNFSEPKEKYRTYYSGDLEKEKNQFYVHDYVTVGDSFKETWNYFVNKVPRDLIDYNKIKASYERLIEKLKEKIQNKREAIKIIELNLKTLNLEQSNALKGENINAIFEADKKELNDRHNQIIDKYEIQSENLEEIKKPLKPIIEKSAREKCKVMEKIYFDYKHIRSIVENDPSFMSKIYPGTKETYYEILKSYEKELNEYPNGKVIYEKIANDIYSKNHDYVKEHRRLKAIEDEAREAYEKMMLYFNSPDYMKDVIKFRVNEEYIARIKKLENKKRLVEKKEEKLELRLEHTEGEYTKFLLTYSEYEKFDRGGRK